MRGIKEAEAEAEAGSVRRGGNASRARAEIARAGITITIELIECACETESALKLVSARRWRYRAAARTRLAGSCGAPRALRPRALSHLRRTFAARRSSYVRPDRFPRARPSTGGSRSSRLRASRPPRVSRQKCRCCVRRFQCPLLQCRYRVGNNWSRRLLAGPPRTGAQRSRIESKRSQRRAAIKRKGKKVDAMKTAPAGKKWLWKSSMLKKTNTYLRIVLDYVTSNKWCEKSSEGSQRVAESIAKQYTISTSIQYILYYADYVYWSLGLIYWCLFVQEEWSLFRKYHI